jgi:hypothetical protein
LRFAVQRWHSQVLESRVKAGSVHTAIKTLDRVMRRIEFKWLFAGMDKWRAVHEKPVRMEKTFTSVVRRVVSRELTAAWNSWYQFQRFAVETEKKQRSKEDRTRSMFFIFTNARLFVIQLQKLAGYGGRGK